MHKQTFKPTRQSGINKSKRQRHGTKKAMVVATATMTTTQSTHSITTTSKRHPLLSTKPLITQHATIVTATNPHVNDLLIDNSTMGLDDDTMGNKVQKKLKKNMVAKNQQHIYTKNSSKSLITTTTRQIHTTTKLPHQLENSNVLDNQDGSVFNQQRRTLTTQNSLHKKMKNHFFNATTTRNPHHNTTPSSSITSLNSSSPYPLTSLLSHLHTLNATSRSLVKNKTLQALQGHSKTGNLGLIGLNASSSLSPRQQQSQSISTSTTTKTTKHSPQSTKTTKRSLHTTTQSTRLRKRSSSFKTTRTQRRGAAPKATPALDREALSRGEHVEILTFSQTLKKLTPYLWPKGNVRTKTRVVSALACLLLSKVLNVSVPVLFKEAIDELTVKMPTLQTIKSKKNQQINTEITNPADAAVSTTDSVTKLSNEMGLDENTSKSAHEIAKQVDELKEIAQNVEPGSSPEATTRWIDSFINLLQSPDFLAVTTTQLPFAVLIAWGLVRVVGSLTNELKNALFTRISNIATTSIAVDLLRHLMHLDPAFHLDRNTGSISRAIDRGTKSIGLALGMITFRVIPTMFEMALVVGVLATTCGPEFSTIAIATLTAYIAFTVVVTQWRTKFKQQMNKASNTASAVAFDALMNVEAVQRYNNEELETSKYRESWENYGKHQIKNESSLAFLNWGQSTIFSIGLTGVMLLSAQGVINGTLTVGDLVLANALLLQLSLPLNIVGTVYRELKQAVLDMQTMFALRQTKSQIENIENPVDFTERLQKLTALEQKKNKNDKPVIKSIVNAPLESSPHLGDIAPTDASSSDDESSTRKSKTMTKTKLEVQNDVAIANTTTTTTTTSATTTSDQTEPHLSRTGGFSLELSGVQFKYPLGSPAPKKTTAATATTPSNDNKTQAKSITTSSPTDETQATTKLNNDGHEEKLLLNNITVKIPAGSSIAFVGGSGSGKSTILKLAGRIFDATGGEIKVDNVPIKNIELSSLRRTIGIVPQETVLFNDTIMSNIRYANPLASDDDVVNAAKLAEIHESIMKMRDGYQTLVGERGLKISGGQKQRISIARLMLLNPPVVMCDEATSSLDSQTEYDIMHNLRNLTQQSHKTCIYVAHRLSTITHCDQIAVIEDGRIVELGSHYDLLKGKGVMKPLTNIDNTANNDNSSHIPQSQQHPSRYAAMWALQSTVDHLLHVNNKDKDIIDGDVVDVKM